MHDSLPGCTFYLCSVSIERRKMRHVCHLPGYARLTSTLLPLHSGHKSDLPINCIFSDLSLPRPRKGNFIIDIKSKI